MIYVCPPSVSSVGSSKLYIFKAFCSPSHTYLQVVLDTWIKGDELLRLVVGGKKEKIDTIVEKVTLCSLIACRYWRRQQNKSHISFIPIKIYWVLTVYHMSIDYLHKNKTRNIGLYNQELQITQVNK